MLSDAHIDKSILCKVYMSVHDVIRSRCWGLTCVCAVLVHEQPLGKTLERVFDNIKFLATRAASCFTYRSTVNRVITVATGTYSETLLSLLCSGII